MSYLLSFSLGAGLVLFYPALPNVWMLLALGIACTFLLRRWPVSSLTALAAFIAGTLLGSLQLQSVVRSQLDGAFEGQSYPMLLEVQSLPDQGAKATRFLAEVVALVCPPAQNCPKIKGRRLRVSWYLPEQSIAAGERWWLSVRLKRPRGFANPGGFDYHAWLLGQRVVATASVQRVYERAGQVRNLAAVRAALAERLFYRASDAKMPLTQVPVTQARDLEFRPFLTALLIGDQSGIEPAQWQTLQSTGTVHLMAISGLHIGLVAFWAYVIGVALARLLQLIPAPRLRSRLFVLPALASVASASAYAALAGFALPTVRALVACLCVNLAFILGVRVSPLSIVSLCLLIITVLQPMAWQSSGFWLSFLAVLTLIATLAGRRYSWLVGTIKAQGVLAVGLFLPLLMLGQPLSLVSPVANLLVVPVVSLLVIPLLLVAVLADVFNAEFARLLLNLADSVFAAVWKLLVFLQGVPLATWWPKQPLSLFDGILLVLASLMMLSPRALGLRAMGLVLSLAVLLGAEPKKPLVQLSVLDVGQGLAVVLRTPSRTWVYDTGPSYSAEFDAGSQIVVPYLRRQGASRIDLMVSHADLDHHGGTAAVASQMRVERLLFGENVTAPAETADHCAQGQRWRDAAVEFEVLWPPQPGQLEGNNSSCVLLVQFEHQGRAVRILFTGDIDASVERQLLTKLSKVDVLIAPHHGSRSSSSTAFVAKLAPAMVIFSSGYQNRYNHPSKEVVARYNRAASTMLNTATDGAVVLSWFEDQPMRLWRARHDRPKPWY